MQNSSMARNTSVDRCILVFSSIIVVAVDDDVVGGDDVGDVGDVDFLRALRT